MKRTLPLRIAALLATTTITGTCLAQSAQQMLSACRPIALGEVTSEGVKFPRTFETGQCWGMFAMLQADVVKIDDRNRRILGACAPAESTRSQLIQIFVKYAESNPERLHEDGTSIALESLQRAFVCPSAKK